MRRSWPDASEASTFEGRVLTRSSVLVDFRLPIADGAFHAADESIVFVAPPSEVGERTTEYDVIGLAPIPIAPARATRQSFPGSHWLAPPPELSDEVRARLSSLPDRDRDRDGDGDEADEDDLTLPVIELARRRNVVSAVVEAGVGVGAELVGRSTAGRVARLGVVTSLVLAGLAVHALGHARRTESLSSSPSSPDDVLATSHARTAPAVPAVPAMPTAEAKGGAIVAEPVVISGGPPVWIVVAPKTARPPAPAAADPAPAPVAAEKLGLPRPAASPRSAFARL
jgi:hypothetical protein